MILIKRDTSAADAILVVPIKTLLLCAQN